MTQTILTAPFSAQAVNAAGTTTQATASTIGAAVGLSLQTTWAISATGGAATLTVNVLTSLDNSTWDTNTYASMVLSSSTTGTQTVNMPIPYPEDVPYLKVQLVSTITTSLSSTVTCVLMKVTP